MQGSDLQRGGDPELPSGAFFGKGGSEDPGPGRTIVE